MICIKVCWGIEHLGVGEMYKIGKKKERKNIQEHSKKNDGVICLSKGGVTRRHWKLGPKVAFIC